MTFGENWSKTTLGDVCNLGGGNIQTGPFGSQLHAADYVESGIPSVMPQNIGDNVIIEAGIARISEADAARLAKYRLQTNDIVYSRRGDVERRALVRAENDGWLCGTGCLKVSFGNEPAADPTFISHYLGTEESREWIVRHAVGATMLNLNTKILSAVPLTVPPLHEQRAIAEVLGALDDKIAANTKLAAKLADMATAQFDLASTNADDLRPLSDLVSTQYGLTTSAHNGEGPRFLRVTDINKKPWIEWQATPNCTVTESEWSKYRVKAGDILVARMADPGKAALVDESDPDAVFASYLVRLKPFDQNQALYIYYFIRSDTYQSYARGVSDGSVQKNMNAKVIINTDICLPSAHDLATFNKTVASLRKSIQSVLHESHKLAETRDALLPQLMSGKLRVKDAQALVSATV